MLRLLMFLIRSRPSKNCSTWEQQCIKQEEWLRVFRLSSRTESCNSIIKSLSSLREILYKRSLLYWKLKTANQILAAVDMKLLMKSWINSFINLIRLILRSLLLLGRQTQIFKRTIKLVRIMRISIQTLEKMSVITIADHQLNQYKCIM